MGMAAFLPAQQLWRWSTKGHKRARGRILHLEIERDEGEQLAVGDCAIFLSTGRSDRPYVGRLESLWETSAGHMRVRVQWFYHASETEGTATGGRRVQDLKMPVSSLWPENNCTLRQVYVNHDLPHFYLLKSIYCIHVLYILGGTF